MTAAIRLLLATLALVLAAGAPAGGQEAVDPRQEAVEATLKGCLRESSHLLVLMLIDESRSLRSTDPDAARVPAIKAALDGLAGLAATPIDGRQLIVEVRLAAFASIYRPLSVPPDWRAVTEDGVDDLFAVADRLAQDPLVADTDYVTALEGAYRDLADRSAELTQAGGRPPCQALVWFTDGRFELVLRGPDRAGDRVPYARDVPLTSRADIERIVSAGRELICRRNGIADRIRAAGVQVFTVALSRQLTQQADDFLRAISEGGAAGACGAPPRPGSGLHLSSDDPSALRFLFRSNFDTPAEVRTCKPAEVATCSFTVVPGLSRFSLEVELPEGATGLALTGPAGDELILRPPASQNSGVSGAEVRSRWFSPQSLALDADLPAASAAWQGSWRFAVLGPASQELAGVRYTIRLRADLFPGLAGAPALTAGEPATLTLVLVDRAGAQVVDSPLLTSATLSATLIDAASGAETPLEVTRRDAQNWQATLTPMAEGGRLPQLELRLRSEFMPAPGITIATELRQLPLTVGAPPSFPRVETRELLLPSVRGRDRSRGMLTVVGPDFGPGCVWFTPAAARLDDVADIAAMSLEPSPDSAAGCLSLGQGERREVAVTMTPRQEASGRAGATLVVHLVGTEGGTIDAAVPVSFALRPAPETTTAVSLLIVLLAAGILLPVGLLVLLNWLGARFAEPGLLMAGAYDVVVSGSGQVTGPSGEPAQAGYATLAFVSNAARGDSARSLELDGGRFRFATRALGHAGERRPSLFGQPYAVVSAGPGDVIAGAGERALAAFPDRGCHEVPLALAQTWVFAPTALAPPVAGADLDPDAAGRGRSVRGRLLVIVPASNPGAAGALLLEAGRAIARRMGELRPTGQQPPPVVTTDGRPEVPRRDDPFPTDSDFPTT